MKYIKSFQKYLESGQIVTDDEEIIVPFDVEITGHIGTPVRQMRVQKIGKSPKVKLKKAAPDYPEMQKRTNQNNDATLLNSLPSQS